MSETGANPWSKFRFWLGVAVVGFLAMAMAPDPVLCDGIDNDGDGEIDEQADPECVPKEESPLAGFGAFGCCLGTFGAIISAIAASNKIQGIEADGIIMSPTTISGGHQVMSPGQLIGQLTEISTAQGMTNAAALRHHAGVPEGTPIDVMVLQAGLEKMGIARLDEVSAQAILNHLDLNQDQILQESEIAPHHSHADSTSGTMTAESMIKHLSSMASSEGTSLDVLLRANSSAEPDAPVEPIHVQEALSHLGVATIDEASADVLLREMAPSFGKLEDASAIISEESVATKALVEKHLNEILDKAVSMDISPDQVIDEATPQLMALTEHLDPETKNRVLGAWDQAITPTREDASAMDSEKRAAIAKGVAGAVAGLTLTGAAAASAASLRSSLSSAGTAAPSVAATAFGDAERVMEEFREEAAQIAEEGGDVRSIENALRTAMRAKTADLPFGVRQKVERELDDVIHTTAKGAAETSSKMDETMDSVMDIAVETVASVEDAATEKIAAITEVITDKIEQPLKQVEASIEVDAPLSSPEGTTNLLIIHEEISGLAMHSERQKIIAGLTDPLSFDIVVERTERSFSVSADHLRGGQTIHGHLPESPETHIQVRIPPNTEEPKVGETFQATAFVKEWSAMRRCLVFDSQE